MIREFAVDGLLVVACGDDKNNTLRPRFCPRRLSGPTSPNLLREQVFYPMRRRLKIFTVRAVHQVRQRDAHSGMAVRSPWVWENSDYRENGQHGARAGRRAVGAGHHASKTPPPSIP